MLEKHPFGDFVPPQVSYAMLGGFVTKPSKPYDWFYANGRNQFWPIMEVVYGVKLDTRAKQQALFVKLQMALADIILACERRHNSNLDINLYNMVYNTKGVTDIISGHQLKKIYFTSRFVENLFRRVFKDLMAKYPTIEYICLPSPSPRYAMLTKSEKIARYRALLPKLK